MNSDNLREVLAGFWTPKKCGKSGTPADFIDRHDMILTKTLRASPADLVEQLAENRFRFQDFDLIPWSDFLRRARLAEYLDQKYVEYALDVTTARPAIGKGEFLFVSCFSNLAFAEGRGDILEADTGRICEFKGLRSTLSGDGREYRQMNKSLIYSIFSLFDTSAEFEHFNRECAHELDVLLEGRPELLEKVLARLQNVSEPDMAFVKPFAELYRLRRDLFAVVGAMQLSIYMKVQKATYILFTSNEGFTCFGHPASAADAYRMVTELKLSSWYTGDYGMTIGL